MEIKVMERLSNRKWRELLGGYIFGTTRPWRKPLQSPGTIRPC